jgi:hypothetical protein
MGAALPAEEEKRLEPQPDDDVVAWPVQQPQEQPCRRQKFLAPRRVITPQTDGPPRRAVSFRTAAFTKTRPALKMNGSPRVAIFDRGDPGALMPTTGEIIRMMNYVDDLGTTLRRISANIPFMAPEEQKKLAEYMRKQQAQMQALIDVLEKGH